MKGLWLAGVLPYATEFYWCLTFLGDRITSIAVKAMAIGQCQTAEIAQEFGPSVAAGLDDWATTTWTLGAVGVW